MNNARLYALALTLMLLPIAVVAQSHDFEVRGFHEATTDLSAATSGVRDINGGSVALIRFAVRDPQFVVTGNNGNISQEMKTGELWVYVPLTTKRLDIFHPRLGILRGYQIPVKIKAKTTYVAEIVITGNASQQASPQEHDDFTYESPRTEEPERVNNDPNVSDYPVYENYDYLNNKPYDPYKVNKRSHTSPDVHFILNAGFNALSVMGPTAGIGLEIGKFFIGGDYTFGINKVEGVGIYYKVSGYGEAIAEAYDYSASKASVRLGFNFSPESSVQVVPQAGVSFNMVKGDEVNNLLGSRAQFGKCNTMSAFVAVHLRFKLSTSVFVYAMPQYDFAVGSNEVYQVIKEADSKLKAWGEGLGVSAGLLFRF